MSAVLVAAGDLEENIRIMYRSLPEILLKELGMFSQEYFFVFCFCFFLKLNSAQLNKIGSSIYQILQERFFKRRLWKLCKYSRHCFAEIFCSCK